MVGFLFFLLGLNRLVMGFFLGLGLRVRFFCFLSRSASYWFDFLSNLGSDAIVRFRVLRYVHRIGILSIVIEYSDFTERLRYG